MQKVIGLEHNHEPDPTQHYALGLASSYSRLAQAEWTVLRETERR